MKLEKSKYDVVIVGARIAGSALATLLAKENLDVLIVDRERELRDVISTHFINPRGLSYLDALGLGDKIRAITPTSRQFDLKFDDYAVTGSVSVDSMRMKLDSVHKNIAVKAQNEFASVRRKILDPMLLKSAVAAGAEFVGGYSVQSISEMQNQFRKVKCVSKTGEAFEVEAKIVVGADGRKSTVAELLQIPKMEERLACTFASYTYFTGLNIPEARIYKRNRYAYAAVPTNDEQTMVLVFGPKSHFEEFAKNREENFYKLLDLVDPAFAAEVRNKKRVEPFYTTVEQSAFIRKRAPQNTVLIGDAHSFKDQCTASGMTHALRDAFLLAEHLIYGMKHLGALDLSLQLFHEKRYLDSHKFYIYTCQQAEMNPLRPEEKILFEAISKDDQLKQDLIEIYCDITTPSKLFGQEQKRKLLNRETKFDFAEGVEKFNVQAFDRPLGKRLVEEYQPFEKTVSDYGLLVGSTFEKRAKEYQDFYQNREDLGLFQYARTLLKTPGPVTKLKDNSMRVIEGINFASQDYLGLANHPAIKNAAIDAIDQFGPHSAASPMVIGNTTLSEELEDSLKQLTKKKHVLLFPTGYAAGIGSILGLVKANDHIVMDRFSHACLQQGAKAATKQIHYFTHLDPDAARAILRSIRERDRRNAILLVTEGIFSMDSDAPDLREFQKIAKEFDATLFVDVAHDLGAMGPNGSGQLGIQNVLSETDLIMGSFSKTFATNGGFLATDSSAIYHYIKMYSSPYMFSNALSPIQTAVALQASRIVQSAEGEFLRARLLTVVKYLRSALASYGLTVMGEPSAIVPVMIGSEYDARLAHRKMMEQNIAAMILEYPIVPLGAARFRLQVMAQHTIEQADTVARAIARALEINGGDGRLDRVHDHVPSLRELHHVH